jgi:flagellar hook protein FlgE
MSTLTGHLSLYATQSLKAIDNWMNVTQGNIGGSLRTAYKEVELMYGGNLTHELRSVSQTRNGVQIAEQTLTTGNTRINWRQGEIINSTQDTHFAINGDGFFLVVDPKVANVSGFFTGRENGVYLTRQGDFHFSEVTNAAGAVVGGAGNQVLVNNEGMVVMADFSDGPNPGNSDNIYRFMTQVEFNQALPSKWRPSVVQPTYDVFNGTIAGDRTQPISILDYDELQYSKYGSGIFQSPTSNSIRTIVNGSNDNFDNRTKVSPSTITGETTASFNSTSRLIGNALEASNVKIERNITELASMGKIYNGFVQLIKVYNSNLDEVLGFIR